MTEANVEESLSYALGSLFALLSSDAIALAITTAQRELGWSFPLADTDKDRCFWMVNRAHRNCLSIIRTEAAYKFDYKQVKLSNRFDQLNKLVIEMDEQFAAAREAAPSLFGIDTQSFAQFGSYIAPGFVYTGDGIDVTYNDGVNGVSVVGNE